MSNLMAKMPTYSHYRSADEAAEAERVFRHALGFMLKECGEHLLGIAETKTQILSTEMEQMIDDLIDRISLIFRRLDREGAVSLVGDSAATIAELEELDIAPDPDDRRGDEPGAQPGDRCARRQLVQDRRRPLVDRSGLLQRNDRRAQLSARTRLGIRIPMDGGPLT